MQSSCSSLGTKILLNPLSCCDISPMTNTASARCQPISFALKRSDPAAPNGKDLPNVLTSGRSISRTKTPTRRSDRRFPADTPARSRSRRHEREGRRRRRRRHSRARRSSSSSPKAKSKREDALSRERSAEKATSEAPMETEAPSVTETVLPARVEPGLPFLSFREFVLTQRIEMVEAKKPEQLVEEYKVYDGDHKRDCQERYWAAHTDQGILRDSYHPENLRRLWKWRCDRGKQMMEHFLTSLASSKFEKLHLCYKSSPSMEGHALEGVRQIKLPKKQLQDLLCLQQEHVLVLEDVPRQVSVWDIHDQLSQFSGFEDAFLGGRDLAQVSQAAFAHFSSELDLKAALSALSGGLALGDVQLRAKAVEREGEDSEFEVSLIPAMERVEEDLKLASQLVRALDSAVCISAEDTEKVAAAIMAVPEIEHRLDLHILYLRKVHNCCFYSGEWCTDPYELRRRVGAGSLRQAVRENLALSSSAWISTHCERIRSLIARAAEAAKPPPAKPSSEEEPLKSQWLQCCQELTKKEAEDRFRCTRCKKLFRGVNFLQKHVFKVHLEVMAKVEDNFMEQQMKEAFFRDAAAACQAQRAMIQSS
ncbi:Ars2 [Symbiodinium sp. CCMP2592]|nr:Ars2 [Symbiodinium sp. CCMP2592]